MTANMGSRRAAQNDMIINDDLDTFTFTLPKPTPEFQQANRKAEDYWKKFHTKMTAATSSGPKAAAQPAVSPQVQAVVRPQAAPPSPKPPVASFSHFAPVGRAEPAQAAIAPVVRKDEDGDVLMEDIEDPVTIQSVSDAVMLSRYTQKGKKEESVRAQPGGRIAHPSCVFVLDTSFILTHQKLVTALAQKHNEYKVVILFPWTTIQELDGISKGYSPDLDISNSSSLSGSKHSPEKSKNLVPGLARKAIILMHKRFEVNDPAFWGQRKEECIEDLAGDDAILDCARYFNEKEGHKTVLLSNDRNLSIKATVYGIKAISLIGGLGKTADEVIDELGLKAAASSIPAPVSAFVAPRVVEPASTVAGLGSPAREVVHPKGPAQWGAQVPNGQATQPKETTAWNSTVVGWGSLAKEVVHPKEPAWGSQVANGQATQPKETTAWNSAVPMEIEPKQFKPQEPVRNMSSVYAVDAIHHAWNNKPVTVKPIEKISTASMNRQQTLEDSKWGNKGVQEFYTPPPAPAAAVYGKAEPKEAEDPVFKAKLLDILNAVDHVVVNHLSSMVMFFAQQTGHNVSIETLADLENATAVYFPMGDPGATHYLPTPFRTRLAAHRYSKQAAEWKDFCSGQGMAGKPSEWDIRDWITDLTKLWKILYGPGLSDIDKKTINSIVTGWMANVSNAYS